jgi:hypothetical protein
MSTKHEGCEILGEGPNDAVLKIYYEGEGIMNKIYSSALVFFLSMYGVEAWAQQSVWTIRSATCEAINQAQSQKMEWRATGLVNRDPSRSLWVLCPVISKFFDSNSQDSFL